MQIKEDRAVVEAIAHRALTFFPDREYRDVLMDIMAVEMGGCPMRLRDWLAADDSNFIHDVAGIYRHLNRQSFQLEDCFVPRFAANKAKYNAAMAKLTKEDQEALGIIAGGSSQ